MQQENSPTYFFFDYETWGTNPAKDRPSQFAGVRTDMDFNIIGEPLVIYCQLPSDYLPAPEAALITGITPQKAMAQGSQLFRSVFLELAERQFTLGLTRCDACLPCPSS